MPSQFTEQLTALYIMPVVIICAAELKLMGRREKGMTR